MHHIHTYTCNTIHTHIIHAIYLYWHTYKQSHIQYKQHYIDMHRDNHTYNTHNIILTCIETITHTIHTTYILTCIQTITHTIHTTYIDIHTNNHTYNTHIHRCIHTNIHTIQYIQYTHTYKTYIHYTYKTYIHKTHVYVCHVMSYHVCMYVCHVM